MCLYKHSWICSWNQSVHSVEQWPRGQGVFLSTHGSWVQVLHRVTTMILHTAPALVSFQKWTREWLSKLLVYLKKNSCVKLLPCKNWNDSMVKFNLITWISKCLLYFQGSYPDNIRHHRKWRGGSCCRRDDSRC